MRLTMVCRVREGQYQEEILVDGEPLLKEQRADEEVRFALEYIHSFSTRDLLERLCLLSKGESVLVFRIGKGQMQRYIAYRRGEVV